MMESQCDYSMYFPAAPISSLSDAAGYAALPRRKHVYLGETVHFLLVLRFRNAAGRDESSGVEPWKGRAGSLSALASVCAAESRQQRPSEYQPDLQSSSSRSRSSSEDDGEEEPGHTESGSTGPHRHRAFTQCNLLLTHNSAERHGPQCEREPVKVRRIK